MIQISITKILPEDCWFMEKAFGGLAKFGGCNTGLEEICPGTDGLHCCWLVVVKLD
jgi:hypothetical protein